MPPQFTSICGHLRAREFGAAHPHRLLPRTLRWNRLQSLSHSTGGGLRSRHRGPLTCSHIERIEGRYLLSGAADASLSLYDLEARDYRSLTQQVGEGGTSRSPAEPLMHLARGSLPAMHKYSVSSVQWYPVDTGAFLTCATDGFVKVWNTETFRPVSQISCGKHAYVCRMSSIRTTSTLHHSLAVGTDMPQIRLCDIRTRRATHLLEGHRDGVWALDWSPTREFVLASGSADCSVRLWDVRKSGRSACLMSMDMHQDGLDPANAGDLSSAAAQRVHATPHTTRAESQVHAHDGHVNGVLFASDGSTLVTTGHDGRVKIWDPDSGRLFPLYLENGPNRTTHGNVGMAMSRGLLFFPVNPQPAVQVFSLVADNGDPVRVLEGHVEGVVSCALRPFVPELVTSGRDGLLLVWDSNRADRRSRKRPGGTRDSSHPSHAQAQQDLDTWSDDEAQHEQHAPFVPPIVHQYRVRQRRRHNQHA